MTEDEKRKAEEEARLREQQLANNGGWGWGTIAAVAAVATLIVPLVFYGMQAFGLIDKDVKMIDWIKEMGGDLYNKFVDDNLLNASSEKLKELLKDVPAEFSELIDQNREAFAEVLKTTGLTEDALQAVMNGEAPGKAMLGNPDLIKNMLSNATIAGAMIAKLPELVRDKVQKAYNEGGFSAIDTAALAAALKNYDPSKDKIADILKAHVIDPVLKARGETMITSADIKTLMADKDKLKANIQDALKANNVTLTPEQLAQLDNTASFVSANADKLQIILGDKGLEALAALMEKGQMPDLSNLSSLLSNPELKTLRDAILTKALTDNAVEDALKSLDFSSLDSVKAAQAKSIASFLSVASDKASMSNLDVLANVAKQNETAIDAVLGQIATDLSAASVTLTPEVAAIVKQAVKELDFETPEAADLLTPMLGQTVVSAIKAGLQVAPGTPGQEGMLDGMANSFASSKIDAMTKPAASVAP